MMMPDIMPTICEDRMSNYGDGEGEEEDKVSLTHLFSE